MINPIAVWVNRFINWITRGRRLPLRIASIAIFAGLALLAIDQYFIELRSADGSAVKAGIEQGAGSVIDVMWGYLFLALGFLILIYELVRVVRKDRSERRILISLTGLDVVLTEPAHKAIGEKCGAVETHDVSILEMMSGRTVVNPEKALERIEQAISYLKRHIPPAGDDGLRIFYAGLGPGPFILLLGYLVSNKNSVEVWDYLRDEVPGKRWTPLDGLPSVKRWHFDDVSALPVGAKEVAMAISLTYEVKDEDIHSAIGVLDIIHVGVDVRGNDAIPANEDQVRFSSEFRHALNDLCSRGIEKVHLFCASQASIYFRIGQQIDGNHPNVIIYQYTPDSENRFFWGVSLNNRVSRTPSIEYTEAK